MNFWVLPSLRIWLFFFANSCVIISNPWQGIFPQQKRHWLGKSVRRAPFCTFPIYLSVLGNWSILFSLFFQIWLLTKRCYTLYQLFHKNNITNVYQVRWLVSYLSLRSGKSLRFRLVQCLVSRIHGGCHFGVINNQSVRQRESTFPTADVTFVNTTYNV